MTNGNQIELLPEKNKKEYQCSKTHVKAELCSPNLLLQNDLMRLFGCFISCGLTWLPMSWWDDAGDDRWFQCGRVLEEMMLYWLCVVLLYSLGSCSRHPSGVKQHLCRPMSFACTTEWSVGVAARSAWKCGILYGYNTFLAQPKPRSHSPPSWGW